MPIEQKGEFALTNKRINPRRSEVHREIRERGVARGDKYHVACDAYQRQHPPILSVSDCSQLRGSGRGGLPMAKNPLHRFKTPECQDVKVLLWKLKELDVRTHRLYHPRWPVRSAMKPTPTVKMAYPHTIPAEPLTSSAYTLIYRDSEIKVKMKGTHGPDVDRNG